MVLSRPVPSHRSSSSRRLLRLPLAATAALLLAACDSATAPSGPITHLPRALTASEQSLISGSNDFAFSLFREIDKRAPAESNIFISPLSASMALGMTMNGAAGSTLDAMRTTLGFGAMSVAAADSSYRSLIDLLRGLDPSVDFRIANSIWYRQEFAIEQSFLDAGKTYFDAAITGLDFDDPSAATTINDWVNESTDGKISRIVDQIPGSVNLYLIDAIYFKGAWTQQFDKAHTFSQPFHLTDGATQPVQMMHGQHVTVRAVQTGDYQAAELPYGGGAYAMLVLVPNEGVKLDSVIAALSPESWQALRARLIKQTGEVDLPRFTLTWGDSLNDPLKALGMGVAFDPNAADFSRISTADQLYITGVLQKTFVDVNEEGTTAAAATSVGVGPTSVALPLLEADRPFLFAIEERLSGTILFIGKMVRPPGE
ncbi:MAG TPA: serpin family protein [Gemmatimonadaceae bacterium]|nr:serpin family protein [Gemmatimonadaceae bacterium]